jgi:hypothetical protein
MQYSSQSIAGPAVRWRCRSLGSHFTTVHQSHQPAAALITQPNVISEQEVLAPAEENNSSQYKFRLGLCARCGFRVHVNTAPFAQICLVYTV